MTWQDLVFGAGQLMFAIALFPALASPAKPPRFTCVLTVAVLLAFAGTFSSLGLWWSMSTSLACGALWIVLALQERA